MDAHKKAPTSGQLAKAQFSKLPENYSLFDAIRSIGGRPPENIAPNKITRFQCGDKSNLNGWVFLFTDCQGATYGDWVSGESHTWQIKRDKPLSKAELSELRRKTERAKRQAEIEKKQRHELVAKLSARMIANGKPASADHPYLVKKKIKPYGLLANSKGLLLVPMYDGRIEVVNVQTISPTGEKRFQKGGQVKGCFAVFGDLAQSSTLLIAEGVATAISLHEHTGHCAIAAMSANNLLEVSQIIKSLRPDAELILCGDNDANNVGQQRATEAAKAVRGKLLLPPSLGDWNDHLSGEVSNG
jgi:putative DNA primase/helicase